MEISDPHNTSRMLETLEKRIDEADLIYSMQFQSFAMYVEWLIRTAPGMPVEFAAPGQPAFRATTPYADVMKLAPQVMFSSQAGGLAYAYQALDTYLFSLSKQAYSHISKTDVKSMDPTWYRVEMIQTILDVDPSTVAGYHHVARLHRMIATVINAWAAMEVMSQRDYFDMLAGIKQFVRDFELAVLVRWPGLRLEGIAQ